MIASSTPAHDLRSYSDVRLLPFPPSRYSLIEAVVLQAITQLTEKLRQTRKASAPKRKFEFKATSAATRGPTPAAKSPSSNHGFQSPASSLDEAEPQYHSAFREASSSTFCNAENGIENYGTSSITHPRTSSKVIDIKSLSNACWVLETQNSEASSILLADIQQCLIDLSSTAPTRSPLSTLTIYDAKQSLIICGAVAGATHITGLQSSTLVLDSRQVRVHDCTDCVFYLRCDSKPIIENCSAIRFAPKPTMLVSNRSRYLSQDFR